MAARAVLITGATGKQGGSVIDALLKANAPFEILAVTRNAQAPSSQRLVKKSSKIKLVPGNLDATEELFKKAGEVTKTPIWGVFSVQAVTRNETRQGQSLIDASIKNGVSHFVYSSADRGGAKSDIDPTNVPHFITKYDIEQHLFAQTKKSDMTWTVFRPVAFFDNLTPGFFGKVFTASWAMKLRKDQTLQLIATSDIGTFAAQSFMKPESDQYKNKSMSLAGDEMTYEQYKAMFEKTTGKPLPTTYHFLTGILHRMAKELGYMFTWFREVGFGASVGECKTMNSEVKNFETWLKTESAWKSN